MDAATEACYFWDNAWEQARDRLTMLERVHDPATFARLADLGVAPGWRCLDVGSGGGSVVRWLCHRVGPTGTVVAVDIDTRFLAADPPANLEVHERDVLADGIPGDGYDFVHTRMVLVHLHERERLLAGLLDVVRPGGWVLFEEADFASIAMAESALYREAWAIVTGAVAPMGMSGEWVRRLPGLVTAAGFTDVNCVTENGWFTPGSDAAQLLRISFEQALPVLDDEGRNLIARCSEDLASGSGWFPNFAITAVRARRPA